VMQKPPLINFVPRFPSKDMKLGNHTIAAGDPVWVSVGAAHADPTFAGKVCPESTISTRAHLSWGAGPRQCPARELAGGAAAIGVSRLFERLSGLELSLPVDQLPWRSSPFMRGLRSLPVRYTVSGTPALPVPPVPPLPAAAGSAPADEAAGRPRSSLWRYLAGLVRGR